MTLTVTPVKGANIQETFVEKAIGAWTNNVAINGFAPQAVSGSLAIQLAQGATALIEGHYITESASPSIAVGAGGTHLWLQLTRDTSGNCTGAAYLSQVATPADAIKLCDYTDNGSAVTSVTDKEPYGVYTVFQQIAPDPPSPNPGQGWYNQSGKQAKFSDGTTTHVIVDLDEAQTLNLKTMGSGTVLDHPLVSGGYFNSPNVSGGVFQSPSVSGGTFNTPTIVAASGATLVSPTSSGGTFNSPVVSSGILVQPQVSGGAFLAPTVSGGTLNASTYNSGTFNAPLVNSGIFVSPLVSGGTFTLPVLSSGTVVSGAHAAASVVSGNIASGAVIFGTIASGAVSSGTLASGLLTVITSGSVVSGDIGVGVVGGINMMSGYKIITITPNGPTDGGDFGPNTAGTQTTGFQEALAKLQASSVSGGKIRVAQGLYSGIAVDIQISGLGVWLDFDPNVILNFNSGAIVTAGIFYWPAFNNAGPVRITGYPVFIGTNSGASAVRVRNASNQNGNGAPLGFSVVEVTVGGLWQYGVIVEGVSYYGDYKVNLNTTAKYGLVFQNDPVNGNPPNNNKVWFAGQISGFNAVIGLMISGGNSQSVLHFDGIYSPSGTAIVVATSQNKIVAPRFETNAQDIQFIAGANNNEVLYPTFTGAPNISGVNSGTSANNRIHFVAGQGSLTPLSGLQAGTPLSGVVYQNTNLYDIILFEQALINAGAAPATFTAFLGASSSPPLVQEWDLTSGMSSRFMETSTLRVPAGWYYEYAGSGTVTLTALTVSRAD